MKRDEGNIAKIKKEIENFFELKGLTSRIIYRTCRKGFGNESPHNLLPQNVYSNHVTVYLDFNGYPIEKTNLGEIIAFLDTDSEKLPKLSHPRLGTSGRPKVNLETVPKDYKFNSIDDLFANFLSVRKILHVVSDFYDSRDVKGPFKIATTVRIF